MYVMNIKPEIKDFIKQYENISDSEIQPGFSMEALFTTTTTDCTTDCIFKYNHSVTEFMKMILVLQDSFIKSTNFAKSITHVDSHMTIH